MLKIAMKCYEMPHYSGPRPKYTDPRWKHVQLDVKQVILRLEVSARMARSFSGTIAIDNLGNWVQCRTPSAIELTMSLL